MTRRASVRTPDTPPGGIRRYGDRIYDDKRVDPYQARGKYREPTVCTDCGALFQRGRWTWGDAPKDALRDRCPACRRVHDKLPAGSVTLEGDFYAAHREELLRLVRNEAEHERGGHPMNRIMDIDESRDRAVVTTTDIHTPHRIGAALSRAYHGDIDIRYGEDEYSVRVSWRR